MKKCPSCNADCEARAVVCPVCGHSFAVDAPKRTMMGFPSLAAALEEAERQKPDEPEKHTLFGFPAQKAFGDFSEASEALDGNEAATSIISASEFAFDGSAMTGRIGSVGRDDDDEEPSIDLDLRGTVAGRPLKPREELLSDATEIVSGAAVFHATADFGDDDDDDGPADVRNQGTLMGMSLADVAQLSVSTGKSSRPEEAARTQFAMPAVQDRPAGDKGQGEPAQSSDGKRTQFAMPAPQLKPPQDQPVQSRAPAGEESARTQFAMPAVQDKPAIPAIPAATSANEGKKTQFGLPTVSDLPDLPTLAESSDQQEESPTQAWNPISAFGKDSDADGRKKLLEKIREASTPAMSRDTPQGPDLSALQRLKKEGPQTQTPQTPQPPRDDSFGEAPPTGVLRKPNKRPDEWSRQPSGSAEYSFGPGELPSDDLGESISDPDFGLMETDIASGELLQQALDDFMPTNKPQQAQLVDQASAATIFPTAERERHKPVPIAQPNVSSAIPQFQPSPQTQPSAQTPQTQSQVYQPTAPEPARPYQPAPTPTLDRSVLYSETQPTTQPTQPTPSAPADPWQQSLAAQPQPQSQPQPGPANPQQTAVPFVPPTESVEDANERMILFLQRVFGFVAGVIPSVGQAIVLAVSQIPSVGVLLPVMFGMLLGGIALVASLAPVRFNRSVAFTVVAGLFFFACIGTFVLKAGATYLFCIVLGFVLSAVAAVFPRVARLVL